MEDLAKIAHQFEHLDEFAKEKINQLTRELEEELVMVLELMDRR